MTGQWLPVLAYHSICDDQPRRNPFNLRTSIARLEHTLRFLRDAGFSFLDVDQAFEAMMGDGKARRLACLTFDDGYRDFLSHALPVLREYRCPAALFLVSERIGKTNEWDAERGLPEMPLLDPDEVRHLAQEPLVTFGAHSATHPWLTRLPHAQRDKEVAGSRQALEALLQREVRFFAYPHYDQDDDVRHRVENAGFTGAFAGEGRVDGPFALPRLNLRRVDPVSLRFWCGGLGQRVIERASPLYRLRRRLAAKGLS